MKKAWLSARFTQTATLIAVLLGGFAFRVFLLSKQSLWFDEAFSLAMSQRDLVSLTQATAQDFHPPLFYYVLKLWVGFAGTSEFSARYLSLIFGVLIIPVSYAVASQFFGKRLALVATAIAAVSPFYVHYSQEVRIYTLVGLSGELAVYYILRAVSTEHTKNWIGYVVFLVPALYSHMYAVFVFALANLAYIALAASLVFQKKSTWFNRSHRAYLFSQIAVIVLYLPWLQIAAEKFADFVGPGKGSPIDWIVEQTLIVFSLGHSVLSITTFPGNPDYQADLQLALLLSLPFVAAATFGTAAALLGRSNCPQILIPLTPKSSPRSSAVFAISYFLVPLALVIVTSLGKRDYNGRYLFLAAPAYYLLVALGISALSR